MSAKTKASRTKVFQNWTWVGFSRCFSSKLKLTFPHRTLGWLGGSVVRALARDRKVASSTPGLSATE